MEYSKIKLARELIYNKDYQKAAKVLEETEDKECYYQIYSLLTIILLNGSTQDKENAENRINDADNSTNIKLKGILYRELSRYFFEIKDYKKAEELLNKMIKLGNWYETEAYYYLGTLKYKTSNYYDAINYFGISVDKRKDINNKTNSKNIKLKKKNNRSINNTLIYLVRCYMEVNEYDIALNILNNDKNFLESDGITSVVEFYKGKCYFEKNEYEKSLICFKKASANKNDYIYLKALLELGRVYFKLNKYNEARNVYIEIYNQGNKKDKVYAIMELAKLELSIGDSSVAKKYLTSLLNEDYNTREFALLELGRLERKEKNYDKSSIYFNQLLNQIKEKNINYKVSKTYNILILELGKIEMYKYNYNTALEYFKKVSQSKSIKDKYIGNIYCVYSLIKEKKYDEAYIYLKELKQMDYRIKDYEVEIIEAYLLNKLGKIKNKDSYSHLYYSSQMINYNRFNSINKGQEKDQNTFYYDYEKVFNCCEDLIMDKECDNFTYCDSYYLEFDNKVANIYGYDTNKLEVFTISNTKNIIAIKPVLNEKVDHHVKNYKKN